MSVLVVRVDEADREACSDWLFQLGATAIEERDDPEPVLVAGFATDELALQARSVLSERWPCRLESTGDEASWRDEWMKWIEPIQVAGFVVHAPWHDPQMWTDWGDGLLDLSIDPGSAFGSGHHPTTRQALSLMQRAISPGDSVLDVGCGTGILSIAAAKLDARPVVGIDLDYDIIEVAAANAEANGVADRIDLRTDPVSSLGQVFDVVVANIVVGDLSPIMRDLVERARRAVIVSGYLDEQFDALLRNIDVSVVERSTIDDWGCALLRPTVTG